MTDRELNIALREMARSDNLCNEWYGKWSDDSTIDECLDRYVRGFDFCVKYDYPPLEFIRAHFEKDVLKRHNIYIDDEVTLRPSNGTYIFLGNCKATLRVTGFKAVCVYCRHDSVVDVKASRGSRVFVTYYDTSNGHCEADAISTLKIYDRRDK